ncbi:MAG: tRNA lysidine(34) synthetase TilS [Oscillospiraceae bacterium]|nr:tRNA lysidine(34) synthetase TilS [Oscillospiraceae bacterium]
MDALKSRILSGTGCPPAGICTVAFSGGADSTALLLCLHELQEQLQLDLRAVHVHHGIRGEEADRDAAFCAALCEKYGIPFQLVHVDVPAFAAEQKLSLETAARRLRYEALESAAPEGVIATAHHAGDNAETVLFHLIRGSGMKGLRGILPHNGRICRPLLSADKSEILSFLLARGQGYVEDSTNAENDSSRNRIRHSIMPLLLQENPAALRHIAEAAEALAADDALLREQAEHAAEACAVSGGLQGLADYPAPLRMRVYLRQLERLPVHVDPNRKMLEAIDGLVLHKAGKLTLTRNVYAQVHRGILYIRAEMPPSDSAFPLKIGRNMLYPDKICEAVLLDTAAISRNYHKADTRSTLDFDKIKGKPYFRQWRGTDRIRLPGRSFSSALKTCVQAAVPIPERRLLYALYDAEGCIYCEQIGIAARVKPDADSRRILTLQILRG